MRTLQTVLRVMGIMLLLSGCLTAVYLRILITNAHIEGVISNIVMDIPVNAFASFECPSLLRRGESGEMEVTISNPTADNLQYAITISAESFSLEPPAQHQTTTLSGNQSTTLKWTATALSAGNQSIVVQATSDRDLELPGLFHMWPTSFREVCGVFVVDGPFTSAQMASLIALSIVAGTMITFPWLSRIIRARVGGKHR